jgi:hypothetical protein
MSRFVAVAATAVLAAFTAPASGGAAVNIHTALQVTSQGRISAGPTNAMAYTGSGVVPGIGRVSIAGQEGEGCPHFVLCGKSFALTLSTPSGSTLQIRADWTEQCEPVYVDGEWRGDMFCPGQISNELVPMPSDVPITQVSGTGRFASLEAAGTVSWSAVTEYPDFDDAYPYAPGTSLTIYLEATLSPH